MLKLNYLRIGCNRLRCGGESGNDPLLVVTGGEENAGPSAAVVRRGEPWRTTFGRDDKFM
jgi:hypothetical protein